MEQLELEDRGGNHRGGDGCRSERVGGVADGAIFVPGVADLDHGSDYL